MISVLGEGRDDCAIVKYLARLQGVGVEADTHDDFLAAVEQLSARYGHPAISNEALRADTLKRFAEKIALKSQEETARLVVVLDADREGASAKWARLRAELFRRGLEVPDALPAEGLHTTVGPGAQLNVWIMPNNRDVGALEDFVFSALIPQNDPLRTFVDERVQELLENSHRTTEPAARFPAAHASKARLRMWLACQANPGFPPGHAVLHGVLTPQPSAAPFVAWLRRALAE